MKTLYFILLLFVVYTYIIYPIIVILLAKIKPSGFIRADFSYQPFVSVVIAAKDEEKNIEKRLTNLINQTYYCNKFEIIIVSDGSTDSTNQIVADFINAIKERSNEYPFVNLVKLDESRGKSGAINKGIKIAKGEIVVLSDARQQFEPDVINQLVSSFSDNDIGAVSGELFFRDDFESDVQVQMGAYWKYEKAIRRSESVISSVVGATGAIYAIRKKLFEPIRPETLIDDVLIPMSVVLKGYRVIFNEKAVAYDIVSKDSSQEWKRKVRTLAGNWQLINLMPSLYSPFSNPLFIQFLSHKVFRTLVPFCLPVVFLLSFMIEGWFFILCALVQVIGYGLAMLGYFSVARRTNKLVGFSYFFVVMNLAAINGFWIWVTGRCSEIWQPAYKER